MPSDCVFCKIVAGELPACKVHEDDDTLAFMDIGPLVKGHALVIPKSHYEHLTAVPAPLLGKVIAVAQRVAAAQISGLGADGVNLHQSNGRVAGQIVPHIHFHVVPRFKNDGYSWNWRPGKYADRAEMDAMGERIRSSLRA